MTQLRPAAGPPSASGARRGGDSFQDLMVWGGAMRLIGPGSSFSQLEVESRDAAHVDDLVLRLTAPDVGDLYTQVKWTTNTAFRLDEAYLLARTRSGRSVLEKLYRSYVQLSADGTNPQLRLVTNRPLDTAHPLLGHVDGRTDLLMPYASAAGATSEAGKVVDAWAAHVGATRAELLTMLEHLQFHPGRTVNAERDYVRAQMIAAGLDDSDTALQHGLNIVAGWVEGGRRVVTGEDVHEAIDRLGLGRSDPSAILVVQAIDHDPHAAEATVTLDWTHLFDGDTPWTRIQPRGPHDWEQMDQDLTDAARTLESDGWTSTLVRGAMRQATFFRVGTVLPAVRQHTLRYVQGPQLWSTDAPTSPINEPLVHRTPLDLGGDIAVAVGVAVDPTEEVVAYLRAAGVPAHHLLTTTPNGGADDQAIPRAGHAVAYAQHIRCLVRGELCRHPDVQRIHLFLAGPGGLALLLGHRWNRTRQTVVYEHLGVGRGYLPAFTTPG
jgi:hypothetical protein